MNGSINILCVGDVVGRPGREALCAELSRLKAQYELNLVIANAENAAGGVGVDAQVAHELHSAGVDVLTLGDHTWHRKPAKSLLDEHPEWIIRPANYPPGAPGRGWTIWRPQSDAPGIGVLNLLGRVFMNSPLDCPFRAADEIISGPLKDCRVIVVDMHAEATSEKNALAHFLDGRVSLVVGTHTHVQTSDERILAGGTGMITDLGMCGPEPSVIGMDVSTAIGRFMSGVNIPYTVAAEVGVVQALMAQIDTSSGKCQRLERIRMRHSK